MKACISVHFGAFWCILESLFTIYIYRLLACLDASWPPMAAKGLIWNDNGALKLPRVVRVMLFFTFICQAGVRDKPCD